VRRLVASGTTPICTARRPVDTPDPGTTWAFGDLADADYVDRLMNEHRPGVVYHLASEVTGTRSIDAVRPTLASNLIATVNILQAATDTGAGRVVLIGSGDEPEGDAAPCSPYAAAKWAAGGYARMFHALYGTPVTTARPFMVYGPDQPDASKVVPYSITALRHGDAPVLSSGRRLCDWIYIDDVVDALLALSSSPACIDRVMDVGVGQLHSVRHVVETICELMGGRIEPVFGGRPDRPGETEAVADATETTRLLGWSATTDLRSGLAQTIAWHERASVPTTRTSVEP
jgi:nucleoside-diphosphate-sugar epimerase